MGGVGGAAPGFEFVVTSGPVWAGNLPTQLLQGDDDVLQVVEGEVDVLGLTQDATVCSCLGYSL